MLAPQVVPHPLLAQEICSSGWPIEETLRIGSIDGEDALWGGIPMTVGPEGEIYVGNGTSNVTVFSPEGAITGAIGRAGSGPGEFDGGAQRLGWVGDTLWVRDRSQLQYFARDGTVVRRVAFSTLDLNEASGFGPETPLSDGTFLGFRSLRGGTARFFSAERVSLPRFSADGAFVDTLAMVPQYPRVWHSDVAADHPLTDWQDVTWLPVAAAPDGSGVVLIGEVRESGRSTSFDLLKIGPAGDTVLKRSIPYEPRPVTRSDRVWLTEVFGARAAGEYIYLPSFRRRSDEENARRRRAAEQAIWFPDHHPPVRRIVVGRDGAIWLLRELTLPDRHDRWELYDASGRFEGHVMIEEGMSGAIPSRPRLDVRYATRDELWGTTLNELTVPYIHRYRVEKRCR